MLPFDSFCTFSLIFLINRTFLVYSSQCTQEKFAFNYMAAFDDSVFKEEIIDVLPNVETKFECAKKCSSVTECKSFYFNRPSLTCQIHDVVLLDPRGVTSPGSVYYIKNPDCYQGDGSRLFLSNGTSMLEGRMLLPTCRPCQIQLAQLTCHNNPTTMYACKRPSTCAEVKMLSPGSMDGEYWLYPPVYGGHAKVKIYCHAMSVTTPTEYLTLPNPNHAYYPNLENPHCQGEYYKDLGGGDRHYSKVRLNPGIMEVVRDDTVFQTGSGQSFGYFEKFGDAGDCYKDHGGQQAACGPVGTFKINTVGTGLITDPNIEWKADGWQPWAISTKSQDGHIIDLVCGGYCGGCHPDRPYLLHLYPAQEPALASATFFSCT